MPNLDFQQITEALLHKLYELANTKLQGSYDVTIVMHRSDLEEDTGGVVAGTGSHGDALEILEENVGNDEDEIVVQSR
jgi:hypothetical protein